MQGKQERLLLNSTSKKVLRQLQENQSLRIELFRLRSDMRDQHHYFLNSTVNHEMLVEKMITQLSLACRRGREVKQHRGENEILTGVIEHCIGDLESLLNSYGKLRGQWSKSKPDASQIYYQKLLKDCSVRFDKAQGAMEDLTKEREQAIKENSLKAAQIEFLQGQLGKLKQKYDKREEQIALLKSENTKQVEAVNDAQLKINKYVQQVARLKDSNDGLSHSLKESREVSNRHTEYLSSKCEGIQKENKRLVDMQRETQLKQHQFSKTLNEKEQEMRVLCEQTHRLRQEVQSFKLKFKQIIEKQNKIKHLETNKHKKVEQRQPLREIATQNSIDSCLQERPMKKQVGKMINRKFNLQSFQQKMTTSNSSTSFFPH